MVSELNDLDIKWFDIANDYITVACKENIWTRASLEFEAYTGKVYIITKSLYGYKISGAAFRAFLAESLDERGFKSSISNLGVWMSPAVNTDGEQ